MERAKSRGALDRFEQEHNHFYERVRSGYLARVQENPARYTVIDAEQELQSVYNELDKLVEGGSQSMTADSISQDYIEKPPVWLLDQLAQWAQRRVSGRAGHALIVTNAMMLRRLPCSVIY